MPGPHVGPADRYLQLPSAPALALKTALHNPQVAGAAHQALNAGESDL